MKERMKYFAFSLVTVLALFGVFALAKPAREAQAAINPLNNLQEEQTPTENEKYIEFTPVANYTGNYTQVSENDTILLDSSNHEATFTVVYMITYNYGINSILLVPEYNKDVFELTGALVDDTTSLGVATMPGEGFDKILLESETLYSESNVEFMTLTFTIKAPTDGVYEFGLLIENPVVHNKSTEAYRWLDGTSLGEQEAIEVRVDLSQSAVKILTYKEATIEFGSNNAITQDKDSLSVVWDYFYIYGRKAVTVSKVGSFSDEPFYSVEYKYNGQAAEDDITVTWYYADHVYDNEKNEYKVIKGTLLGTNPPMSSGDYVVSVSAPAAGMYYAVEEIAYVHINTLLVEITIADKQSVFGDPIAQLTYTASRDPFEGDSFTVNLSTTATSNSSAGTYPISASITDVIGSYLFHVTNINETGTYTITKKNVTLTAIDQTAEYTGSEPTVDQTKYQIIGVSASGLEVTITKAEGVNVGQYTLTPSVNLGSNYNVTIVTGKFTITSITNYNFGQHFSALELTYNASVQDLLEVNNLPNWLEGKYTVSNNAQTNVGTYAITVTITLDAATAANYNGGSTEAIVVSAGNGKINQYDLTITAHNHGHVYGSEPETLTPQMVNGAGSEVLNVTLTPAVELSKTTSVGQYAIVPSVVNSNYNFTFVNGTYTVSKAQATVSAVVEDSYYNRDLNISASGAVNTLPLSPVFKCYSDSDCTIEVTPENVGTYYVKAVVAGTDNYYGAEDVKSFKVLPVQLEGVTFTYSHGSVQWTAVANDAGVTNLELAAKALKEGTTVTYKVYSGETLVASPEGREFAALAATTYKVVAIASNANYSPSETEMVAAYSVSFAEGDHVGNPTGSVQNMPETQYIFAGQTAIAPSTNPSLASCTFSAWSLGSASYTFTEAINESITITAIWDAVTYTVTLKYVSTSDNEGTDKFTISGLLLGQSVSYASLSISPVKDSDNDGIYYTFANKWMDKDNNEYTVEDSLINGLTVEGNMVLVAVFNTNYRTFTVSYWVIENGESFRTSTSDFTYLSTIAYSSYSSSTPWFEATPWYANQELTTPAPKTMPNKNIDVYTEIRFSIGQGDVNASGVVDANDITLYRQYIVGGYTMTVVASGEEWATATVYNVNAHYFLERVADNNKDSSKDIRDISITRMAIVGGYSWDIENAESVPGDAIVRTSYVSTFDALHTALTNGNRARLTADIDSELDLSVSSNKTLYIDLNGHTLTVKSLTLNETGYKTVTVKNGSIVTLNGIALTAANGNVVVEEVTGYDEHGLVQLQAASHSLHIFGNVEFRMGDKAESVPAQVKVEQGTHVVIEQESTIVVEKLVVTENFEAPAEENQLVITFDNYSALIEDIQEFIEEKVVGNPTANEDTQEIATKEELLAIAQTGGIAKLTADINCGDTDILVTKSLKLDLNGHTITFSSWGFEVRNGSTLTFDDSKGTGSVSSVEAALYAQYGGHLVVNAGTYISTNNFVIGTHGSEGRGHNTITINGGTFIGSMQSTDYVACGIYVANDDTVVVNGGTFNIANGVGILARSGNTTIKADAEFTVTGNGTLGQIGDSRVVLPTGKVLILDLAAHYPGGTPTLVNNSDYAVYTIVSSDSELREALGYDHLGVVLVNDINCGDNDIVVSKTHNIDLNGHKITFTNWGFEVRNGSTLTFDDSKGTGSVSSVEAALYAQYGGHLVVNGGRYNATNNFVIGTNGSEGRGHNTITINGGTFNGSITSAGYVACGIYVANDDTVTVNAGTFNITNGVGILSRSGNTTIGKNVVINATGDNNTLGKIGDSRVVLPAGEELVLDLKAGYPGGVPTINNNSSYDVYVVVDGNYTFASDDASFHAARGVYDNVILTGDFDDYLSVNRDMNIYLNGHTVDASGTNYVAIYVVNGASVTINGNGNVIGKQGCVIAFGASEFIINGGTYTCTDNFVFGTNGSSGQGGNSITVNNGTFNGGIISDGYVACGIYVANDDTVTVNGGTFNITNGVGILARSGNTTVNGGTFNVTGNNTLGKVGDSKVTVPAGEVLVLDLAANYPGGTPTLVNNTEYSVYTVTQAN